MHTQHLKLTVLSLRYSSWSMRAWLTLTHAGATFETETVALAHMQGTPTPNQDTATREIAAEPSLAQRRDLGSVHGLFPVLRVDDVPIHESLAICEYVADAFPEQSLWPADAINRARARALCCEMASGFPNLRGELACHLFGRVRSFTPGTAAQTEIERIFELWSECLERSGGPFLFGQFCIADAMYYPVLTRFRSYGIPLVDTATRYSKALDNLPAVSKLIEAARFAPRTPIYDEYLRKLGGDPDGGLPAT